nr:MAG TPA: hypothetical protein [Caudoviricetes sp.]DAV70881.1 MAG TPA: hypothetical protein [Caudoviricetes sp.]
MPALPQQFTHRNSPIVFSLYLPYTEFIGFHQSLITLEWRIS